MPATRTTSLSLSSPTSPSSRKPRSRPTPRQSLEDSRERTERTKRGCWTCRIRRKKCDEMVIDATCRTCSRLRIDCLGWGPKRPEWMKNKEAVDQKKAEIKKQLATQGMIRGQVKALNRAAAAQAAAAQAAASQNSSANSSLAHSPNGGEEEETASSSSARLMMIPSLPAFDPSSDVPLRTMHPRASKQAAVGAIRIQTHPPSEDEDDEDIMFGSKSNEYDSLLQFQGGVKDREASPLSAMSTTSSSDETDLTPLTMAGDEGKDYLNMFGTHHSTSLSDELKSSSTVSPSFSNSPLPQAPSIFGLADPDSHLNVYNSGLNEFTVTSLDRSRPSSGLGTFNTILDMRQIQQSLDAPVNYMSGSLSARPHPEYADPLGSDSGLKGPRPSVQQGPQGQHQHLSRNRQASTSTTTTAISSGSPVIDLNNFMKDSYFIQPGAPATELSTIQPGWLVASPSQIEQDISISHFASSSKSPIPVSKPTVMADIQATHLFNRQSSAGLAATAPIPLSIHTQPHQFTASAFPGQVTPTSAFNTMDQSAAALAASLLMNTPTSAEATANQNLFQFAQSAGLGTGYPDPLASVSSFGPAAATAASMFSFSNAAAPSTSSGSSVLSPQSETLLYYYFNRGVRRMQYLLADDNTTNVTDIMYNLVMSDPNGPVTNAICALSSLYDTRVCISNGSILHDDRGAHDNARKYYALTVKQLQEKSGKYTEVEAIASLHLLSFWLFCGGGGDWASALGIASEWLAKCDIVTKMDRIDPLTALESATPSVRFAAQGTMWMDIFGAVSQRREPRFMSLYRRLRNSAKSRSMNSSPFGPAQPTKSQFLYNVMGCEDDVMFLIAEIAELAAWKEEQIERGTLSMKDLIKRGCLIEEALTSLESTRPERPPMSRGSAPRQTSDPTWMLASTDDLSFSDFGPSSTSSPGSTSSQAPTLTQLASNVFRETATLYLNTVLSGCQPRVSEISQSVRNVVEAIRKIPSSELDRSLIFPLTLAGCLADKPADREFFKDRLATQGSTVGNGHRAKALMEAVWKQRDAKKWNRSNDVVCWREMMIELNFHLLLV